MRYFDEQEAGRLNAEPWQLDLLKANPGYLGWGPHEDYMWKKGDGWDSAVYHDTWASFGPWGLDDLNECVNFYFSVNRESKDCETCGGNGEHPDAQWVTQSWYSHSSPFKHKTFREQQAEAVMSRFGSKPHELLGHGAYPSEELLSRYSPEFRSFCEQMRTRGSWCDDITQDECDRLISERRVPAGSTAAQINAQNAPGARGFGHDAINRWIVTKARCERFGIPYECQTCEGHGVVFTAPAAHVSLTLWWLHPRKGCSRGIEIKRIERGDLPAIQSFLRRAAEQNAQRFSGIGLIA